MGIYSGTTHLSMSINHLLNDSFKNNDSFRNESKKVAEFARTCYLLFVLYL